MLAKKHAGIFEVTALSDENQRSRKGVSPFHGAKPGSAVESVTGVWRRGQYTAKESASKLGPDANEKTSLISLKTAWIGSWYGQDLAQP